MERRYICVDCGVEFVINSTRDTHAKRCPICRKKHRQDYDKVMFGL